LNVKSGDTKNYFLRNVHKFVTDAFLIRRKNRKKIKTNKEKMKKMKRMKEMKRMNCAKRGKHYAGGVSCE
jgi:hypothetical protein